MTDEKKIGGTDDDKPQKNDNENNNSVCDNGNLNNNNNSVVVVENYECIAANNTPAVVVGDDDNDCDAEIILHPDAGNTSGDTSGKTDDERLQEVAAPAEGSEPKPDEDLHEKNESEKSEKDEKVREDAAAAEVEVIADKLEKTKLVDEKEEAEVAPIPSIPEIVEPVVTKEELQHEHDDEKDVCEEEYPDDLNPFGDELPDNAEAEKKADEEVQNVSSNPFGDDDDVDDDRAELVSPNSVALSAKGTPLVGPPKPPRTSLNPFGSDFEDDDDDDDREHDRSARLPRPPPSPTLSSVSGSSSRKKRPAPPPPKVRPIPSPRTSLKKSTPTVEVRRHAPPRPPPPSTPSSVMPPKEQKERENMNRRSQQMLEASLADAETSPKKDVPRPTSAEATTPVSPKSVPGDIILTQLPPNKALSEGAWKKKKGPAPPRPIPPKSQVKKLPRKAVNQVKNLISTSIFLHLASLLNWDQKLSFNFPPIESKRLSTKQNPFLLLSL